MKLLDQRYVKESAIVLALLFAFMVSLSPFYAMNRMKEAAKNESDDILSYVDKTSVQQSVMKLVVLNMLTQIEKYSPDASADEVTFSVVTAMKIAEPIIVEVTEPYNIAAMINGSPLTAVSAWDRLNRNNDSLAKYDAYYLSWDKFMFVTSRKNSTDSREYQLVFEREGFFSWKLKSVKFEI